MAVPNLDRCQLQAPSQEHSATAAAQVPKLNPNATGADAILARHGFTKSGTDKYQAPDGSWIQWNAQRNTWERGIGTVVFRGLPQKLSALPSQRYSAGAYGQQAIAFLPKLAPADPAASSAALTKAGFSAVLPCYFSHPDGSWVAFVAGKLVAGVDGERITGFPKPGSAKPPKPVKVGNKTYKRYTDQTLPQDWATWRKTFAIGKVPRADGQFTSGELSKCLRHLGFQSGNGGQWTHPDGSEVTIQNGSIVGSRFQQWGFGSFPYQNGVDGTRWSDDTNKWLSWAKGQSKQAPFARV